MEDFSSSLPYSHRANVGLIQILKNALVVLSAILTSILPLTHTYQVGGRHAFRQFYSPLGSEGHGYHQSSIEEEILKSLAEIHGKQKLHQHSLDIEVTDWLMGLCREVVGHASRLFQVLLQIKEDLSPSPKYHDDQNLCIEQIVQNMWAQQVRQSPQTSEVDEDEPPPLKKANLEQDRQDRPKIKAVNGPGPLMNVDSPLNSNDFYSDHAQMLRNEDNRTIHYGDEKIGNGKQSLNHPNPRLEEKAQLGENSQLHKHTRLRQNGQLKSPATRGWR
jgi:hypothetical protein